MRCDKHLTRSVVFWRAIAGRNRETQGASFSQVYNSLSALTRPNSLFLSAAAQNGHHQLLSVYKYFQEMRFYGSISTPGLDASERFLDDRPDERVITFLKSLNTGVTDYRIKETDVPEKTREFGREIQMLFSKFTDRTTEEQPKIENKSVTIELAHRGKGGVSVYFDLQLESAGTRRLLAILKPIFRALDAGFPVFIDELDASLHSACPKTP